MSNNFKFIQLNDIVDVHCPLASKYKKPCICVCLEERDKYNSRNSTLLEPLSPVCGIEMPVQCELESSDAYYFNHVPKKNVTILGNLKNYKTITTTEKKYKYVCIVDEYRAHIRKLIEREGRYEYCEAYYS